LGGLKNGLLRPAYQVGIAGIVNIVPSPAARKHTRIEANNLSSLLILLGYHICIIGINMLPKIKFSKDGVLFGAALIAIFFLVFGITYLSLKISNVFVKKDLNPTTNLYTNTAPEPIDATKGVFNILLLGYGGSGHSGGGLTDSLIVFHIDTNTKKYALISIPRDLWTQANRKINAEASVNGFQSVGPALQAITGLPIENFISVDFTNYSKIINNLGGISVEVPNAFTDSFYPIPGLENETCGFTENEINEFKAKYSGFELEKQFTCRYEKISYNQGPAVLTGSEALKFVRSRHGDSDFGRSKRQFAVIAGIAKKLISLKSVGKLDSTIDALSNMIKTDLTMGKIKSLIEIFGDLTPYSKTEVQLTTDNVLNESKSSDGQYILIPKAGMFNFTDIKSYISQNI